MLRLEQTIEMVETKTISKQSQHSLCRKLMQLRNALSANLGSNFTKNASYSSIVPLMSATMSWLTASDSDECNRAKENF